MIARERRVRQTEPEPLGWAADMQPRYARYDANGCLIGTPSRNERTGPAERRVAPRMWERLEMTPAIWDGMTQEARNVYADRNSLIWGLLWKMSPGVSGEIGRCAIEALRRPKVTE